ncbi:MULTISPECIES: hypothetical protein [Pseudoalteromonas]|uniref:hypothetical protein n=1 Tax=Pseudoalteromonas TaxID=53246 RepID=UPI0015FA96B1|nr:MULTISPECIES: hypothetical protein [Pseudoalteromonas]QMW14435.1 hypothetical protein H3302_15455 [Pseudoalteromonas sp. MT33b]|tara:strand:- start:7647 stop:8174 length:528 start_codon:yes stop_codon:yes gene_type:complete
MKKQLIPFIALLTVAGTTHANEINIQALQACTFVENDFNRLLCYDNIMAGKSLTKPAANKQIEKPVTGAAAVAAPAVVASSNQVVKTKNEDFGLEHKEATKDNDDEISAVVKSVEKAAYGELIIELKNGQQWRQIGSDSLRLKANDTVVIERGIFNSFLLKVEGQNRSIRVKRTN